MFVSFYKSQLLRLFLALVGATLMAPSYANPLVIGYSDWPGWVAWEVAVEKQWFAEAGLDVEFEWFDYAASMEVLCRRPARRSNDDQWRYTGDRLYRCSGGNDSGWRLQQMGTTWSSLFPAFSPSAS